MSKLITQVFEKPKTAFQTYTIQHGIEALTALVPLDKAPVFEQEFRTLNTKSKPALIEFVRSFGGKIKS